jgi:3-isopropylmalate/(R)-2-methylmalate dehydratase small subunit
MEPFTALTAVAAPMPADNIDTDQIIANRDLIRAAEAGYGDRLFARRRYRPDGSADPDFVLNREPYREAQIILTGANFGCGSSREAAAWALRDFGIRALIAPSYGAIFRRNCIVNGIVPVALAAPLVATLAERVAASRGHAPVTVDLAAGTVAMDGVDPIRFAIADIYRRMLLDGTDIVLAALAYERDIDAFEQTDRARRRWARLAAR